MVIKLIRTVNDVRNPKWINAEHTLLNCEVDFDELDEVYVWFTADPNDIEEHGRQIYADCVAGNYGEIEEFDVAAFEAEQETIETERTEAQNAKDAAKAKLKAGTPLTDDDLDALGLG
jgi:hypothetical protein